MNLTPKRIVILGATSAIGMGIAKRYAKSGSLFFLVARDAAKVEACAQELLNLGAGGVRSMIADLRIRDLHDEIVQTSADHLGSVDLVLIPFGVLPDQQVLNNNIDATLETLITNALSPISLAHRFVRRLELQGTGSLVVFSSVAGERGRRGNFAYGAAKSALNSYAAGLRGTAAERGVHVLTVKPGPVETPMTKGRKLPLMVGVDRVADDIVRAIENKRLVIYTPGLWRFIMFCYRLLPERIAMKLNI